MILGDVLGKEGKFLNLYHGRNYQRDTTAHFAQIPWNDSFPVANMDFFNELKVWTLQKLRF